MAIRNNKKTTELVLLFNKKTTKLVFPWLFGQYEQKNLKVLILYCCYKINYIINTLMFFWPILGQRKKINSLLMKKENEFSCLFGHNIISNDLYQAYNIISRQCRPTQNYYNK